MRTMKQNPMIGHKREILAIPHQYSCGGYWLAERLLFDGPVAWKGEMVSNDGTYFVLLSGRMEVLSNYQVDQRIKCCLDRGEIVDFRYIDELPKNSHIQF